MPRWFTRNDNWDFGGKPGPDEAESREPKRRKRRLATTFVFTTLFFAGASLAAVAGNRFSASVAEDASLATTTTTDDSAQAASADESAAPAAEEAAPASDAAPAPADSAAPTADTSASAGSAEAADSSAGTSDGGFTQLSGGPSSAQGSSSSTAGSSPGSKSRGHRSNGARNDAQSQWQQLRKVLLPKTKPAPKPEIEGPANAATIWLNSPLPDPTPPADRLSPKFAANLKRAAQRNGIDWATMLGILRARGAKGHIPADRVTLNRLAARLDSFGPSKGAWARIVAYSGDSRFADKAAALARYDRAVGLDSLVNGLEASKAAIASRILSDPNISIYQGGRNDMVSDKVDVRVLAMIAYLRESFGSVSVSSLLSGHRLYARPGVISAHIYGRAVDISAVGGVSIQGHQQPGGITERTVREILLLPAEVMPRQVISLLGLGGPSFPLADHYNHIHIGY
ncbi:MAG: hypothetical protein V7647_28 [Acidobacteriota bacterium]|jgi:hypothetical protein